MEREEGWSSEGSDGGVPTVPLPSLGGKGTKATEFQPRDQHTASRGKAFEGPWRSEEHRGPVVGQRRLWEDPSKVKSPARPSKSSPSGKSGPHPGRSANLEDYMKKTSLYDDSTAKNSGGPRGKTNHASSNKSAPAWPDQPDQ